MLVEDDEFVRNHTMSSLQTLGYSVIVFSDGDSAVEAVLQGERFDVLITDIVLPGKRNGKQVADEILKLHPSKKVLFMSGYTENSIVHHGRLDKGVHLLSKPFRLADLALKVRSVIESG